MVDIKISGSGTIASGEYGSVHISGSCSANGSIKCSEMHISGSFGGSADVNCTGKAHFSGSASFASLTAEEIKASGSLEAPEINGGAVSVLGSLNAANSVKCGSLEISDKICAETVEGDDVKLSGKADIKGLLNAGKVYIMLDGDCKSKIGSIGCSEIVVERRKKDRVELLWGLVKINRDGNASLITDSIEGDSITLADTNAGTVRGETVVIGEHCDIKEVEYSGTCTVDPTSRVEKLTKI